MKTKKDFVVALDFDGCIALGHKAKIKYAKILHQLDIDPSQTLKQTYPLGEKKYVELVRYINIDRIMEYELDHGCVPVLRNLAKKGVHFIIVSSRTKEEIHAVKKFVKHHKLHIKDSHATLLEPKRKVCLDMHARALLEDCLYKLEPLEHDPLELFFFRRPWNRHEKLKKGTRVKELHTWGEFEKEIEQMLKSMEK
ncbi:MAG: hypothetical protein Q8R18_04990 [bacterium]|nr:hypothetical protein [bacterium]